MWSLWAGHGGTQKKGYWGCFLNKMLAHVPPSQGNTSGEPNPGYLFHAKHNGEEKKTPSFNATVLREMAPHKAIQKNIS